MNTVLSFLAVAGGAAAAWHLVRAALRFLRGGARGVWAEEMEGTHVRHGDLTALEESRRARAEAYRSSRRSGAAAVVWLAVLTAPTLTPWPRAVFAAYTVFWAGPLLRRLAGPRRGER